MTGKPLRIADMTFEVMISQGEDQADSSGRFNRTTIKHQIPQGVINTDFRDLSDGQRRVLRLLVQGASEKEAATSLNVSYHTIHCAC